jgi:hypothetical protein
MEIYEGALQRITHTIYVDDQVAEADNGVYVTVRNSGGETVSEGQASLSMDEQYWHYLLTQDVTNVFDTYAVTWEYETQGYPVVYTEEVIIVKPVVTFGYFNARYPDVELSGPDFRLLESVARKVIETYCNQTFSKTENQAVTALGMDSDSLPLPRRIIRLDSLVVLDDTVDSQENTVSYDVTEYVTFDADDPWAIRRKYRWGLVEGNSPISRRRFFKYPNRYRVVGDFGWDSVPQAVRDAASLLIVEYMQPDNKYRQRYVDVIRAGDWRMEFEETGMTTTGNADADAMLSQYRNLNPGVI